MIKNAFVCYFDVLGFTSRFLSGAEELSRKYDELIDLVREIQDQDVSIFLMSDSIVVVSEEFGKFLSVTKELYTWGILNDFWLRGAITRGNVTRYRDRTIMEKNRFILPFLGEGYLRAYSLETTLNISGVAIDHLFFEIPGDNPGFKEGVDYIKYEEYLPKPGYEGMEHLLLPTEHTLRQIIERLYFAEMLESHVEDVDKYINTFCFYIRFLSERADTENLVAFLNKTIEEFEQQGRRVLIPSKVVTIFIALIEGLLIRSRSIHGTDFTNQDRLELLISKIITSLKEQGYLSAFVDTLLQYDKKRHTSIYKDINSLRSSSHIEYRRTHSRLCNERSTRKRANRVLVRQADMAAATPKKP